MNCIYGAVSVRCPFTRNEHDDADVVGHRYRDGGRWYVIQDGSPHTPLQGGTDRVATLNRARRGFEGAVGSAVFSVDPPVKSPVLEGYPR